MVGIGLKDCKDPLLMIEGYLESLVHNTGQNLNSHESEDYQKGFIRACQYYNNNINDLLTQIKALKNKVEV